MDCETCRALLDDFVLGELSEARQREVKEHLAGCQSCRTELKWAVEALKNSKDPRKEKARHQASLWLEKRNRTYRRSETPLQRMIKYILVGGMVAMVIIGVRMRAEKFRTLFPKAHETPAVTIGELIKSSVEMTPREEKSFWPMYTAARNEIHELNRELDLIELRVKNFTPGGETSWQELLTERQEVLTRLQERKNRFFREAADLLGEERVAQLLKIEDRLW